VFGAYKQTVTNRQTLESLRVRRRPGRGCSLSCVRAAVSPTSKLGLCTFPLALRPLPSGVALAGFFNFPRLSGVLGSA